MYTLKLDWTPARLEIVVAILRKSNYPHAKDTYLELAPYAYRGAAVTLKVEWGYTQIMHVCQVLTTASGDLESRLTLPDKDHEVLVKLAEVYGALADIYTYRQGVAVTKALILVQDGSAE